MKSTKKRVKRGSTNGNHAAELRAYRRRSQLIGAAIIASSSIIAMAASVPNTFTSGSPALASDVNANFQALATAVTAMETKLASLSLETVNGQPTVRFSGVNLQVVNGQGTTGTVNGVGNLIVGYDELDISGTSKCSLGTNPSNQAIVVTEGDCLAAGGIWATSHKSGSHNLVLGLQNNYSQYGGLVSGARNTSNYRFASLLGGYTNMASGEYAVVTGGSDNSASGNRASVSGGQDNTANGGWSSVTGGRLNLAGGGWASITGGSNNVTSSGPANTVNGGQSNSASGQFAVVSGGTGNVASGIKAVVSGGNANRATGDHATASGGWLNRVSGNAAVASGGYANFATGANAVIGGGSGNTASHNASTVGGGSSCVSTQDAYWAVGVNAAAIGGGCRVNNN
ncbi:MAG: hypothetical protein OEZ10_04970 [Gammaproteobacteria bacterium]|nr:hypothetical protein [Gammaproteobacteria bacterium]